MQTKIYIFSQKINLSGEIYEKTAVRLTDKLFSHFDEKGSGEWGE
ncbi:MAG: hypothetical protein ACYTXA_30420 [Nostoc sp.]